MKIFFFVFIISYTILAVIGIVLRVKTGPSKNKYDCLNGAPFDVAYNIVQNEWELKHQKKGGETMEMADLVAEIKRLRAKVAELESKSPDDARLKAIEEKLAELEPALEELKKGQQILKDSDFDDSWD